MILFSQVQFFFNFYDILQGAKKWKVVHFGKGVFLSLDQLKLTFKLYSLLHALLCVSKELANKPHIKSMTKTISRKMVRSIRRLLWPGTTGTTINFQKKGQNRAMFHGSRCNMALGKNALFMHHIYQFHPSFFL